MPESFVNQATGRCSVDGSKYWFNCNPDGPYHWFKANWIDRATGYLGKEKSADIREKAEKEGRKPDLKNLLYIHFTMDDNLSLSGVVKERYRSMYSGVFFKRYIMGLWAMAEGIIYDMFDVKKHVVDVGQLVRSGKIRWTGDYYVSCDYGTQNATMLAMTRKSIFEQGMGIDPDPQNFGNSSGVALKYLYSLLELKAGLMETEFRPGFGRLVRAICRHEGMKAGRIVQTWTRTAVHNEAELTAIAQQSTGILSRRTILENHPWVTDADKELEQLEREDAEAREKADQYGSAFQNREESGTGGDGEGVEQHEE